MEEHEDSAETILEQYEKCCLADANEAATRLKVIDDVLYRVLGWTHDDISPEERVSEDGKTTWSDYVIRTGMTAIVIEAKKVGIPFSEIPNVRRAPLKGNLMKGETGRAIIQARDYARKLAVPFAAITNGSAWVVFPATRVDQVSFENSSAIIFPSIVSALRDDFSDFHELLSRGSVISGSLENDLLGRLENQIEARRLNAFYPSGFSKITRHSLYPLIEESIATAFAQDIIASDQRLLKKLYVQTPDRRRFDAKLKIHLQKRASVAPRAPIRATRERGAREVTTLIEQASTNAKPLAMLVLGQVGAGKTTFLDFTRRVSAAETFAVTSDRPYPHWLYLDFRAFSPDDNAHTFIIESIFEAVSKDPFLSDYERCVKHAYKDEIEALFRGPLFLLADDEGERKRKISSHLTNDYEKKSPYVEKILRYAARNVGVFLVIDNIDQFEREGDQEDIFANAMAFSNKIGCSLICAMREGTFVRHRASPTFDAFDFEPISIEPPLIQSVLSKRFSVAGELLVGKSGSFTAENGARVQVDELSDIIELVQGSVLGTPIGNLIEVLSTGDVRLALRMTREFLRSGWTASGKAYRIYKGTGKYVLPAHEALRAIMIGNQQQYYESHSVLANPFDSRLARTEAQMLRLFTLSAFVQKSVDQSIRPVSGDEIKEVFRDLGFGDDICLRVLKDLCNARFLHTEGHGIPSFEANYILTRLGAHAVKVFPAEMMFLENVMMDTFIADTEAWSALRSLTEQVYSKRNIMKRMEVRRSRVKVFFGHMDALYKPLQDEALRRALPAEWCANPLASLKNTLDSNLKRISASAQRNYGHP